MGPLILFLQEKQKLNETNNWDTVASWECRVNKFGCFKGISAGRLYVETFRRTFTVTKATPALGRVMIPSCKLSWSNPTSITLQGTQSHDIEIMSAYNILLGRLVEYSEQNDSAYLMLFSTLFILLFVQSLLTWAFEKTWNLKVLILMKI